MSTPFIGLPSHVHCCVFVTVQSAGLEEEKQLIKENEELRKEIESVKTALFLAEVGNGGNCAHQCKLYT